MSFLFDALSYSWLDNNQENELQIYEQIGLVLYYQHKPLLSAIFHERFASGICEPPRSTLKMNTVSLVEFQEHLPENGFQKDLNAVVLNRLNLPF